MQQLTADRATCLWLRNLKLRPTKIVDRGEIGPKGRPTWMVATGAIAKRLDRRLLEGSPTQWLASGVIWIYCQYK